MLNWLRLETEFTTHNENSRLGRRVTLCLCYGKISTTTGNGKIASKAKRKEEPASQPKREKSQNFPSGSLLPTVHCYEIFFIPLYLNENKPSQKDKERNTHLPLLNSTTGSKDDIFFSNRSTVSRNARMMEQTHIDTLRNYKLQTR